MEAISIWSRHLVNTDQTQIVISVNQQELRLIENQQITASYAVSTALNGVGNLENSGCTPLGLHKVRIKIGADCPVNTVFTGRRPTGEIFDIALAESSPNRDWILTRILWLTGCESGINRGGQVDTLKRFIYIHGTPDSEPMGMPQSHGCIRMRNKDLVALFDRVEKGTPVEIIL
jgi:hypothetical protein